LSVSARNDRFSKLGIFAEGRTENRRFQKPRSSSFDFSKRGISASDRVEHEQKISIFENYAELWHELDQQQKIAFSKN